AAEIAARARAHARRVLRAAPGAPHDHRHRSLSKRPLSRRSLPHPPPPSGPALSRWSRRPARATAAARSLRDRDARRGPEDCAIDCTIAPGGGAFALHDLPSEIVQSIAQLLLDACIR